MNTRVLASAFFIVSLLMFGAVLGAVATAAYVDHQLCRLIACEGERAR